MKKIAYFILAVSMAVSFSAIVFADEFQVIGREIYPGTNVGDKVVGALFVGKFYDGGFARERGRFSVVLDNDGKNIEVCNEVTKLLRFKLIMNFDSGARLVLVGPKKSDAAAEPIESDAAAEWKWNDPDCPDGNCPLTDYHNYIVLFNSAGAGLLPCDDGDGESFIAEVGSFNIIKQIFGSYRTHFKSGSVSGWLVHTPIVSPAIFGTVSLSE